jgi:hypothetical protein
MEPARELAVLSLALALIVSAGGTAAHASSADLPRVQTDQLVVDEITAAQSALRLGDDHSADIYTRSAEDVLLNARNAGFLKLREDRAIAVLAQADSDEQRGDATAATATLNTAAGDLQ